MKDVQIGATMTLVNMLFIIVSEGAKLCLKVGMNMNDCSTASLQFGSKAHTLIEMITFSLENGSFGKILSLHSYLLTSRNPIILCKDTACTVFGWCPACKP